MTLTPARSVGTIGDTVALLGPLRDLPGFWQGQGFSLIARPDRSAPDGVFLELNIINETIEFTAIGSPVPNRGSAQNDIDIYGVTYLHRVTDAVTSGALHIEPGMWLTIPATTEPASGASIARLLTVPHGNAVCTVGTAIEIELDGVPTLPPISTVPYPAGATGPVPGAAQRPEYDLSTPSPFRTQNLPAAITQAIVDDPTQVLRDRLSGQRLRHITRLVTSTDGGGGLENIPFITTNADAVHLDSSFAIETVSAETGDYLQLQYAQIALLEFGGTVYPHVSVGSLVKAF